jgi:hypothetical protein
MNYCASPLINPLLIPHFEWNVELYLGGCHSSHLVPWRTCPGEEILNELWPHNHRIILSAQHDRQNSVEYTVKCSLLLLHWFMLSEGVTMTKMTKEWQLNTAINIWDRGVGWVLLLMGSLWCHRLYHYVSGISERPALVKLHFKWADIGRSCARTS